MTLSVKGSAGQAQWRPFREFENLYGPAHKLHGRYSGWRV